jgi:hypothetical protein
MKAQPYDDHEREEDVEYKGNCEVWDAKADHGDNSCGGRAGPRDLVVEHYTRSCVDDINQAFAVQSLRVRVRTNRDEVHQKRKDDNPGVLDIHNIATIELEERSMPET